MKRIITLAVFAIALLFALNSNASAQTMYFCEGVDNDGYAITPSSVFNINSSGGYLYVLTRLPYSVGCNSVRLEIYRNGNYDNTIYLDTEKNWTWFWKQITFYKSGDYTVYLYNCYDELVTTGDVRINFN